MRHHGDLSTRVIESMPHPPIRGTRRGLCVGTVLFPALGLHRTDELRLQ